MADSPTHAGRFLKSALPRLKAASRVWRLPVRRQSPIRSKPSRSRAITSFCQKTVYGGTYNLLAHTLKAFGVTTTFVNAHDLSEVEAAIQPNTKAIYLETLGNPNSDIPDIDAISAIAHKHNLPSWSTIPSAPRISSDPLRTAQTSWSTRQRSSSAVTARRSAASSSTPASSTGAPAANLLDCRPEPQLPRRFVRRCGRSGSICDLCARHSAARSGRCHFPVCRLPLLQGTETLSLRLERHAENTKKVVEFLKTIRRSRRSTIRPCPTIPTTRSTSATSRTAARASSRSKSKGGQEAAFRFIDNLEIFPLCWQTSRT